VLVALALKTSFNKGNSFYSSSFVLTTGRGYVDTALCKSCVFIPSFSNKLLQFRGVTDAAGWKSTQVHTFEKDQKCSLHSALTQTLFYVRAFSLQKSYKQAIALCSFQSSKALNIFFATLRKCLAAEEAEGLTFCMSGTWDSGTLGLHGFRTSRFFGLWCF